MKQFANFIQGFGYSLLFILLGFYILQTKDSTFGTIVGYSCIIFFGGLLVFAIFKKLKDKK